MKNKHYIFLDIDGVLATSYQYYTNKKKWHPTYDCYRFDEKCVKVFNSILNNLNDVVIILSSDWQNRYSLEVLNDIFKWNGVNCYITDVTGTAWGTKFTKLSELEECRAYDIVQYAKKYDIKKYLAIDDLDLTHWLDNYFIHTPRANEGIKQSGIKEKILNNLLN
ncbi:MAG: HAD domain-containing protein [Bacteroidales bacterium]|jgi:hypothetical protein|nr:HAD domain-containing protein [Bacteroidales bacterium]